MKIISYFKRSYKQIVFLSAILLLSAFIIHNLIRNQEEKMKKEFLTQAKMLSKTLQIGLLQKLEGSEKDLQKEEYKIIKNLFIEVSKQNELIKYIYILGKNKSDEIFFFIDNVQEGEKDHSPPGSVYKEASKELIEVFYTKNSFIEGPLEDEWGIWVSSIVPIIDNDSKVIAIFGIDIDASDWSFNIFKEIAIPLIYIILVNLIIIFIFLYLKSKQQIVENETRLKTLFNAMNDVVLICNADGIIEYVADTKSTRLYKNKEEIINKSLFDIFNEEQAKYFLSNVRLVLEKKESIDITYNLDIAGKNHWFYSTISPLSNNSIMLIARDITKSKEAEKSLVENEELFKKLIITIPDIVLRTDLTGTIIFINEKAIKKYGYDSVDDIIGQNMLSFIAEKDINKAIENTKLMFEKQLGPIEYTIKLKNNVYIDCEVNGDVVFDSYMQPIGMVYIIRDITERKKIEKELKIAKDKYQLLLNNSYDIIININPEGIITYVSPSWKKLLGHSIDEVEGHSFLEFIYYDDIELSISKLRNILQDKSEIKNLEYRVLDKNGFIRWHQASAIPVLNENGEIISIVANVNDITEKKVIEKSLIEKDEQLKSLINSIPDIVCFKDKDGCWLEANEYLLKLFHLQGINYYRKTDNELAENSPYFKNSIIKLGSLDKQVYNKKEILRTEETITSLDGKEYIFDVIRVPLFNEDDTPKGLVIVGRDITDRKRTEKELLIAKEKAEESDKLKSAFLANLSHEIRTPINGILGFSQLLRDESISSQKRNHFINNIQSSTKRLLNTINDIIEISRIESNQLECNISEVNPNQIIQNVYNYYLVDATKKGLVFKYNLFFSDDIKMKTDPELFKAILNNLINNAIKFTDKGFIEVGYELKEDFILFYVKDTGIGISPERQSIIFERFMQADNSSFSRSYEGSGLGLAISKAYIEKLGGKIWVESDLGKGSTFYFTHPFIFSEIIHKEKGDFSANRKQINMKNNFKILIAEDDEMSLSLLKIVISDITENILVAENGQKAIELAEKNMDIDIILLDIKLPILDGYKVLEKIREFNKDVVIIAQTAYALYGDRDKAIKAGFTDYISKPIDENLLKSKIQYYLDLKYGK